MPPSNRTPPEETRATLEGVRDHDEFVPDWPKLPDRYQVLEFIAAGGMGEVWRVRDTRLDRVLAAKILRAARVGRGEGRFEREARTLARLDHPAVVGIVDIGTVEDGRPWFTMPLIRGRTLRELIDEAHSGGAANLAIRRLLDVLRTVANAVAYAHERDVVHRDIKPSNVMVGGHGEVYVLDWGISRLGGELDEQTEEILGPGTRIGSVLGTPGFLAPEQKSGDPELHLPAADVWALGATLYTVLAGKSPDAEGRIDAAEMMALPSDLVELIDACRSETRPSAAEFAQALRDHLDGAKRAEQARAQVQEARPGWARLAARRIEAAEAEAAARRAGAGVPLHAPVEAKRPRWTLEDRARECLLDAELAELEQIQTVRAALNLDPSCADAHTDLSDHFARELIEAESHRDDRRALRAEVLLREHDRGEHEALLRGYGRLVLETDPPGVLARIERYVERDRRLVPEEAQDLGRTPLEAPLRAGSYRVTLVHTSGCETVYPVLIRRGGTWVSGPVHVPEAIPEGWCYVPGGPAILGGDLRAPEPLPHQVAPVEGFLIRRFPVTVEEYRCFLEETELFQFLPRSAPGPCGLFRDGELWSLEEGWDWEQPVGGLCWEGARACAAWLGGRLPTELEWEKAARGVDGRGFPWGNGAEQIYANMMNSRAGPPLPASVSDFPIDASPYGVRGLAGGRREWCADAFREADGSEDATYRNIRGGGYFANPDFCRAAARFAGQPANPQRSTGVRPARSL